MANKLDLDALAKLDAAATPGPWHVRYLDDDHAMNAIGISVEPETGRHEDMASTPGDGPELLAATLIQAPPYVIASDRKWHENAALIVALRNALPELLQLAKLGAARSAED